MTLTGPTDERPSSVFLCKEPCPSCGSRDNLARYSDGHGHCFGCEYFEPADDENHPLSTSKNRKPRMSDDLLPQGEFTAITSRGISEDTCRRYGYSVGRMGKKRCHIAAYRDQDNDVVAQHIRLKGKEFPWIGDTRSGLQLFGQHATRDGASKVIITEGEIDAMSVYEVIGGGRNRWGVVSIYSGAKAAKKDIAANLQWLSDAEEIVLMFDTDDPGTEAARECARMFEPGKCKIASLPLKDANEMLQAGRGSEIVDAIFEAKEYRPQGIKTVADVRAQVVEDPVYGLPYFDERLTKATLGRRMGELAAWGAGTGVGKTDNLTQQIEFDLYHLNEPVGLVFLEQQPPETVRRIAGKHAGRLFHIPPEELEDRWTKEDLSDAVDAIDKTPLFMYDHFGQADYQDIEDYIRYLHHAHGVRVFYLDHLTALAAQASNERQELEVIMSRLGGLVKELDIWIGIISHLATPDGKPHEEGGRVMIRHFKGSRAIGFWCHFMFGLERDQQAEDEDEKSTTTLRVLKDRVTGRATGKTFLYGFDHEEGRMFPKDRPSNSVSSFDGDDPDDPF